LSTTLNADTSKSSSSTVVVIGGGPAGATTATLLAQAGHQVTLFESEPFPRFRVGESLMTETYWTLERLGMLDRLRQSGCPVKASVQFISETGKTSRPFYFYERNQHECSYTWQLERAWFDQLMLENAAEKGVDVRMGVGVRELVFDESGRHVHGVQIENGADVQEVRAKVVVDASGQNSLIARRLGLLKKDPNLENASIFAHYENGRRDAGIDEGATLIIQTRGNRGWFWYIPLSDNRVSVGVVSKPTELFGGESVVEKVFQRWIDECPAIKERLLNATPISPVQVARDFSYRATECAGDGWVLVGDAFGFVDPIYSSGVFLALKSGELAADSIDEGLREGDLSGERLGRFGPELVRGMESIRRLVYAFYSPGFSFADFIRQHPEHRGRLTDILIGDVFKDGVDEISESLKNFCDLPDDISLGKNL
jgi:flavin-dependent dehydrogenase